MSAPLQRDTTPVLPRRSALPTTVPHTVTGLPTKAASADTTPLLLVLPTKVASAASTLPLPVLPTPALLLPLVLLPSLPLLFPWNGPRSGSPASAAPTTSTCLPAAQNGSSPLTCPATCLPLVLPRPVVRATTPPPPPQEGGYYPDPQAQQISEEEQKKKDRKNMLMGGAAGLAVGALGAAFISHEIHEHEEEKEEEEREEQSYDYDRPPVVYERETTIIERGEEPAYDYEEDGW
jgi:hypothetical protein